MAATATVDREHRRPDPSDLSTFASPLRHRPHPIPRLMVLTVVWQDMSPRRARRLTARMSSS